MITGILKMETSAWVTLVPIHRYTAVSKNAQPIPRDAVSGCTEQCSDKVQLANVAPQNDRF